MEWIPKRLKDMAFDSYDLRKYRHFSYRYAKKGYDLREFKFLREFEDYKVISYDEGSDNLYNILEEGEVMVSVSFGKNIPKGNVYQLEYEVYATDSFGGAEWGFEEREFFDSEEELMPYLISVMERFDIEAVPFNEDDVWMME